MRNYTHEELEAPLHASLRLYGFEPTLKRSIERNTVSAAWEKNGYILTYQINAKWAGKQARMACHPTSDLEVEVGLKEEGSDERKIFTKAIKSSRTAVEVMRIVSNEFSAELAALL